MNFVLFDSHVRHSLLPFTATRAVADIRCGIYTMRERWEKFLGQACSTFTEPYLQELYAKPSDSDQTVYINGAVFATASLSNSIKELSGGGHNWKLYSGDQLVAFSTTNKLSFSTRESAMHELRKNELTETVMVLQHVWDIFSLNDAALRNDFVTITAGRQSAPIPNGVLTTGAENIFIEEGAEINIGCILNGKAGPLYFGKDSVVLEGVMIRGPFALCEHGVVKMGAKMYGATTIGPGSKVGGEINNAVFFSNSNKSHEGYLGNAVIGEWCNLGADTNCSNLKNNYDEVKIWDMHHNGMVSTGLIFCGLLMGDHSKCGINTMFNTGTVVGVSCNIFGGDFPEKYIPSFSWGGGNDWEIYKLDKAMETANRMMGRRGLQLTEAEKAVFRYLFQQLPQ